MPKLKAIISKLDEVAEPFREFYELDPATQKYILSAEVEDHPSVRGLKNAHERTKEEKKRSEEEFKAKFEGIDPDLARKLMDEHQKQQDKKLIDAGEVDKLVEQKVEQRVKKMQDEFARKEGELTAALNKSNGKLEELLITTGVQAAATKAGVRPTAVDDVLLRAKQTYKIKDGAAIPFDGEAIVYGKDGKTPLAFDEWVTDLHQRAPHLFNEPVGAGTKPGPSGAPVKLINSFKISREDAKDTNLYRQAKAKAEEAGVTVEIVD